MPSLHYLNPPPHPFWDFVAGIEDHPFFAAYVRPPTAENNDNNQEQPAQAETSAPGKSEKAKGKQPSVEDDTEDPPVVDPATLNTENEKAAEGSRDMPCRGRGRFAHAGEDGPRRSGPCGARGRGGCGPRGAHQGPPSAHHGPPGGWPGLHGPWWMNHGPPGPHPPFEGPHAHPPWHGPHRGPGHHRGPHGRSPGRGGPGGFDLEEFLSNLGGRLGIDLTSATEGLGLGRFSAARNNNDADFEPRADVFDTAAAYIIHTSLPGAKKSDLGVDWDGEHSILRIAGVVHRPGADEEMLKQLAVDGRKREVGVFEKNIRLGTRRNPASIDVTGITAKMTDGVLIVSVPKVEVRHEKREVRISSNSPNQAAEDHHDVDMEKGTLLDSEVAHQQTTPALQPTTAAAEKQAEHEREVEMADARSETVGPEEKLPEYEAEENEEDAEEEAEYVKINVD